MQYMVSIPCCLHYNFMSNSNSDDDASHDQDGSEVRITSHVKINFLQYVHCLGKFFV